MKLHKKQPSKKEFPPFYRIYFRMKTLITDIELLAAALAQVRVTIYEPGAQTIADYGGTIEKYTPDYVKVAGTYFRRDIFVFKAPETRKRPD